MTKLCLPADEEDEVRDDAATGADLSGDSDENLAKIAANTNSKEEDDDYEPEQSGTKRKKGKKRKAKSDKDKGRKKKKRKRNGGSGADDSENGGDGSGSRQAVSQAAPDEDVTDSDYLVSGKKGRSHRNKKEFADKAKASTSSSADSGEFCF